MNERSRRWYKNNPDKVKAYNQAKAEKYKKYWATHDPYEETKEARCGRCKKVLPGVDFYKSTRSKTGLGNRCKNCDYLKNEAGATQRVLSKAKARAKARAGAKVVDYGSGSSGRSGWDW